jgi:hypothetical protein
MAVHFNQITRHNATFLTSSLYYILLYAVAHTCTVNSALFRQKIKKIWFPVTRPTLILISDPTHIFLVFLEKNNNNKPTKRIKNKKCLAADDGRGITLLDRRKGQSVSA